MNEDEKRQKIVAALHRKRECERKALGIVDREEISNLQIFHSSWVLDTKKKINFGKTLIEKL